MKKDFLAFSNSVAQSIINNDELELNEKVIALENEDGDIVYVNEFQWEVIESGQINIAILPELYERLMNNEESAFQELFDALNPMFIALNVSKAIALIETILTDDDIKGEYQAKMREGFDFKVVVEVKNLEEIEELNNKI